MDQCVTLPGMDVTVTDLLDAKPLVRELANACVKYTPGQTVGALAMLLGIKCRQHDVDGTTMLVVVEESYYAAFDTETKG